MEIHDLRDKASLEEQTKEMADKIKILKSKLAVARGALMEANDSMLDMLASGVLTGNLEQVQERIEKVLGKI